MKIVLIHGYKANNQSGFFPWLRDELHKLGHEVIVPNLPSPEAPEPEEWTQALLDEVGNIDDQTIVVGHSLGGAQALRFLEAAEARSTPRGAVLISTPWMIKSEKFRGFFMSELDFDVLMWKVSKFTVIHARDDKVIPFDHAEKYAKVLHANLVEQPEGEHFQGTSYPIILSEIEKLINEELVYEPGMGLEDEFVNVEN